MKKSFDFCDIIKKIKAFQNSKVIINTCTYIGNSKYLCLCIVIVIEYLFKIYIYLDNVICNIFLKK